jgi:hypothetical protein
MWRHCAQRDEHRRRSRKRTGLARTPVWKLPAYLLPSFQLPALVLWMQVAARRSFLDRNLLQQLPVPHMVIPGNQISERIKHP